jgi:hypothetical protein
MPRPRSPVSSDRVGREGCQNSIRRWNRVLGCWLPKFGSCCKPPHSRCRSRVLAPHKHLPSWLADRTKAVGLNIVLTAVALLGLVGLARALPGWWVAPAAAAFAFATLLLSFVAPVVLEPLFNHYSPLPDATLAAELRRLAERAGVPIRDMLVQDTSRRTRKANAYVSGLARTRRVVVSDTLLEQASPAEVRLVVAPELGHRRERHVLLGTLLAMAGAVTATVVVWALLGTRVGDPHQVPLVLLIGLGIGLTSLPALTAISVAGSAPPTATRSSSPATGPPTRPPSAGSPRRTSPTSIRRASSTCCSSRTRPRPSASQPRASEADNRGKQELRTARSGARDCRVLAETRRRIAWSRVCN